METAVVGTDIDATAKLSQGGVWKEQKVDGSVSLKFGKNYRGRAEQIPHTLEDSDDDARLHVPPM